jgi:hypothetical protein
VIGSFADSGWAGLCERCIFHRVVTNARGSRFLLCKKSVEDSSFPKYPPLPVRECGGFRESDDA